jgi:Zn-dependent protease
VTDLVQTIMFFLAALPAIVAHEVSHGYVAYLLGDPTAKSAGRLSPNPLKHIDPFGTVLLPALLALAHAPVFGYAKPVPINPYFFKDRRRGLMLTGLAGPATNLVLAIVAGLVYRFAAPLAANAPTAVGLVVDYLFFFAEINLVLMFFNLIPIPPFDGSRVLPMFLPDSAMHAYAQVERYGFVIILALLFLAPGVLGAYFSVTVEPLLRLIVGG